MADKTISTGIAEIDRILSGKGGKLNLSLFYAAPVSSVQARAALLAEAALKQGITAVEFDLEMKDEPPDGQNTP